MTSLAGKCTRIAGYNGEWQYYDVSNPGGSTLQLLEPGKAYWIRVSESCTWDAN